MNLKAVISATSREEAEKISDKLLKEELLAGTLIVDADSRYLLEREILNEIYNNIHAYTL